MITKNWKVRYENFENIMEMTAFGHYLSEGRNDKNLCNVQTLLCSLHFAITRGSGYSYRKDGWEIYLIFLWKDSSGLTSGHDATIISRRL